jgi:hypothetical protein
VRVAAVDGSSNSSAPVKMDDTFPAETVGLEGLRRVTLSFDALLLLLCARYCTNLHP